MKVLDLKGPKALGALNVFSTLMLGLKMLPSYQTESYEDFLFKIHEMPTEDQEKMIREAIQFVNLRPEETEAVLCFCADPNGVAFNSSNIKNLDLKQITDCIVAVCMRVAEMRIDFVSDTEKKNLKISQSTSEKSLQNTQH